MSVKILKKLTLKDVVGGKADILKIAQTGQIEGVNDEGKKIVLPKGKVVPLCTILGQVTGYKPGESELGSYLKLSGAFEATNLVTGEVIPHNGVCIMPNFVADAIGVALQAGAQSVDFAVQLNVQYDEAAATMYVYSAESLLPPTEAKPIAGLKALMNSLNVALPKPAQLALELPEAPAEDVGAAIAAAVAPVPVKTANKGSKR